jgi:hypothetical protein
LFHVSSCRALFQACGRSLASNDRVRHPHCRLFFWNSWSNDDPLSCKQMGRSLSSNAVCYLASCNRVARSLASKWDALFQACESPFLTAVRPLNRTRGRAEPIRPLMLRGKSLAWNSKVYVDGLPSMTAPFVLPLGRGVGGRLRPQWRCQFPSTSCQSLLTSSENPEASAGYLIRHLTAVASSKAVPWSSGG